MTPKEEDLTIFRATLAKDMTSRAEDVSIFRATLVEDMTLDIKGRRCYDSPSNHS